MIFNFLKKRKLPKNILILSALPFDEVSFEKAYCSQTSDYIASLKQTYGLGSLDLLWEQYKPLAHHIQSTFDLIRKYGGSVIVDFKLEDLAKIPNYDIVIILAHHSDISDEIEIGNKMVRARELISRIPLDCKVILDITSCYSAHFIPWIKARIPESKIIGINCPTSLKVRLDIITYIILVMAEKGGEDYIEVFKSAWSNVGVASNALNDIKLGSRFQSTIYAPSEVRKGDEFIVSVFLHKTDDSEELEILSRCIDPDISKRNQMYLKTKLKKGDIVEFQVYFNDIQYPDVEVDEYSKEVYWDNSIESVEFIFTIGADFNRATFIGKIKLAVNKEPIGDMVFKINVVDAPSVAGVSPCCPITFDSYDRVVDENIQRQHIISVLHDKIQEFQCQGTNGSSAEIDMCYKCIDLLQQERQVKEHSPLKVFISSTSDMQVFRKVMENRVESCEMYADMYERWGQGNDYPRDICCMHVLQSDIFVCILGSRYGFIEPLWNKSMTEIEYRIASYAGIPALIYIMDDYKKGMQELSGDDLLDSKRQAAFIEELKSKRLVCLFKGELDLELNAHKELITLKNKLS